MFHGNLNDLMSSNPSLCQEMINDETIPYLVSPDNMDSGTTGSLEDRTSYSLDETLLGLWGF